MFSEHEGEAYTQLGENLLPSDAKNAAIWSDKVTHLTENALHSMFGAAPAPELKDVLQVVFGNPIDINASNSLLQNQGFPNVELSATNITNPMSDSLAQASSSLQLNDLQITNSSLSVQDGLNNLQGMDLSQSMHELLSPIGDLLKSCLSGPLGILGSIFQFLISFFSQILTAVEQILAETARAAGAQAADAWKKYLGSIQ